MEYVTLRNDVKVPILGFGVYQITDYETCKEAVKTALKVGYRHIDTASAYFNEKAVGDAIKESDVPREEIFVTTKVWIQDHGYEATKKAFQTSLDNLGLDYIDLYLIHQNYGDVYGTWRAMEELYEEGKIKAIGVCNFTDDRFYDFALHNKTVPMVLQIEVNPFCQQKETSKFLEDYDTKIEAWSPLAEGMNDIFHNETLSTIGEKYDKSVAQVIIRWLIQRGIIVFPKSTHEERIKENFDVFDFELTDKDMDEISKLDNGHGMVDFRSVDFAKTINQLKIHDD